MERAAVATVAVAPWGACDGREQKRKEPKAKNNAVVTSLATPRGRQDSFHYMARNEIGNKYHDV